MDNIGHYIGGESVDGSSGRFGEVTNPALGKVIKQVALGGSQEVSQAVQAAQKAYPNWSETPPVKRAEIMYRFRELLLKNLDHLAELVSQEHGKTLEDAKGSIHRGLEIVEFCCGIASHLKSDFSANVSSNIDAYNLRQPLGICAGITPFNFPAMVPMWMFPIAISCGNTFILKPSEKDPSCPTKMAELMSEAGLPDGVLNVVHGDKEVVDLILEDPRVAAVSFVGSTRVGTYIYEKGTSNHKRVQALCGAKNHMVVMPDADLDQVADAIIGSVYGSAGERCMAISVVVAVEETTAEEILKRILPKVKSLKIGPYTDGEVQMGPVISKESLERITRYIEAGEKSGAKLVLDGRRQNQKGFFVGGTIFDRVTPDMSIYKDEIFGPVLSLVRVDNYQQALKLVDEHEYGNGAAIFTKDGETARHFSHHAQIGMVGINVPIPIPVAYHSFGGWKKSIFGGHSIHGMEGVRFYTKLKTITTRWTLGTKRGSEFNFKSSKTT